MLIPIKFKLNKDGAFYLKRFMGLGEAVIKVIVVH